MFNFTAAAVNRLSEHHIRFICGILKGNGDYVIPGGIYPAMDAFYHKSPIRYMVIYQLCSLQVAEEELFGAYDMYHFRRDILGSDGVFASILLTAAVCLMQLMKKCVVSLDFKDTSMEKRTFR